LGGGGGEGGGGSLADSLGKEKNTLLEDFPGKKHEPSSEKNTSSPIRGGS